MDGKKQGASESYTRGDAFLVAMAGLLVTYLILVAHTFPHPLHWVLTVAGGGVVYLVALAWFRYRQEKERRR